MQKKFSLANKTIIFYLILLPFVIVASIANLVAIINGTGNVVSFGAFGLFGFILLPLGLMTTYKNNQCIVNENSIQLGKSTYPFSVYTVYLVVEKLPVKDRPLYSIGKKEYVYLCIQEKEKLIKKEAIELSQKKKIELENALLGHDQLVNK